MCGLGQRTRLSWHAVSHAKAEHPQIIVSHRKTQEGNNIDDVIVRREIYWVIDLQTFQTFKFWGK